MGVITVQNRERSITCGPYCVEKLSVSQIFSGLRRIERGIQRRSAPKDRITPLRVVLLPKAVRCSTLIRS